MKKILTIAAAFSALAIAPASAKMLTCTSENIAKSQASLAGMPDGPGKFGMAKEMGMVNTHMSKGNMKGACMHYMNAQKMSAAK
jgi:hypothetical protein